MASGEGSGGSHDDTTTDSSFNGSSSSASSGSDEAFDVLLQQLEATLALPPLTTAGGEIEMKRLVR